MECARDVAGFTLETNLVPRVLSLLSRDRERTLGTRLFRIRDKQDYAYFASLFRQKRDTHSYDYRPNWNPLSPIYRVILVSISFHSHHSCPGDYFSYISQTVRAIVLKLAVDSATRVTTCMCLSFTRSTNKLNLNFYYHSWVCPKRTSSGLKDNYIIIDITDNG